MAEVEACCTKEGAEEVNLYASPYGYPFYIKLGYTETGKTMQVGRNVNRFMVKKLR